MLNQIFQQYRALVPMVLNLMSSEDKETRYLVLQKLLPTLVLPMSAQGEHENKANKDLLCQLNYIAWLKLQ